MRWAIRPAATPGACAVLIAIGSAVTATAEIALTAFVLPDQAMANPLQRPVTRVMLQRPGDAITHLLHATALLSESAVRDRLATPAGQRSLQALETDIAALTQAWQRGITKAPTLIVRQSDDTGHVHETWVVGARDVERAIALAERVRRQR